jgi:hypothetical protein
MRLVMTILLRDEEDILEAQLAYHLAAGVDFVVATDHRSSDSSPEILARYERAGCAHVIREECEEFHESEWVTRMARFAATELGADWVINSSADEFWWPTRGSLREALAAVPARCGVLGAFIRSFLPGSGTGPFWERMTFRLAPAAPINDPTSFFRPVPKVVHRATPDVRVARGSHALLSKGLIPFSGWHPIEVLHFPTRTPQQLGSKAMHLTEAFAQPGSRAGTGYHAKALAALREGHLKGHYASLGLDREALERGLAAGSVVRDLRLRDALRSLQQDGRFLVPGEPVRAQLSGEGSTLETVSVAVDAGILAEAGLVRARRSLDLLEQRLAALEAARRGR